MVVMVVVVVMVVRVTVMALRTLLTLPLFAGLLALASHPVPSDLCPVYPSPP
jgi:hypothetical protein